MGAGLPAEQLSAGTIAPGFSCLHPRASDHPSHPAHIMAGFWFSFDTLSPDAGQHWDGTELTMAMRDWCRAAGCPETDTRSPHYHVPLCLTGTGQQDAPRQTPGHPVTVSCCA